MQIPMHLIELQRAVNAADARCLSNTGANAIIAVAAWSDAQAALTQALTTHVTENKIPRRTLETAVRQAALQSAPAGRAPAPQLHKRLTAHLRAE
ncbi:hypothetical protein [Actinacidiphila glaucinigra]|uniref:hypothetical protein n=1 Tax=Actinacidiphila glaucinigra TaxID=235986 RepID=UPI0035DC7EBB